MRLFMNKLLDNLTDILNEMVENYSLLLRIIQRERQFIIENSLYELYDCIKQKETIILKLRMLEDLRVSVIGRVSVFFNTKDKDITLSYLSDSTPEPYSSIFKGYRSQLLSFIQSIQEINRENKNFIELSMDTMKESFQFLNDITNPRPTYISSGVVKNQVQRGRMVKVKS